MDISKNYDMTVIIKSSLIALGVIAIFGIMLMAAPKPNVVKHPDITIHQRFYAGHSYLIFREKESLSMSPSISTIHDKDCNHIKCKSQLPN